LFIEELVLVYKRLFKIFFIVTFFLSFKIFAEDNKTILFFYSETCHDCEDIKNNLFPKIKDVYGTRLKIKMLTIDDIDNYSYFSELEDHYGSAANPFPAIFINNKFLSGKSEIIEFLKSEIDIFLSSKMEVPEKQLDATKDISRKMHITAIVWGAFIDGINPCVFTVILFFISYLFYLKKDKHNILYSGLIFIIGVFVSYYLLGLGLYKIIYSFSKVSIMRQVIRIFVAVSLGLISILSIRDLINISKGKKIALALSKKEVGKIHEIIRKLSKSRFALLMSFFIGFAVSLLEFPCTGQVYVPIILLIQQNFLKGYLYLFLYNIIFIIPLFALFLMIYFGMNVNLFQKWYSNNIFKVKFILTIFFILLFWLYVFSF